MRKRQAAIAAVLTLTLPGAQTGRMIPRSRLTRRALVLGALAAVLPGAAPAQTRRAPDALFVWRDLHPEFGEFSALHLAANRLDALALSDRGFVFDIRLSRGAAGWIDGVTIRAVHRLRGTDGAPLAARDADAEGLAVAPDGTIHVAFEGAGARSRVLAYTRPDGPARALPRHPDWDRLPPNAGLEALAIDAQGRLFTLPETPQAGGFAVYRLSGGAWSVVGRVPQRGGFVPVGADFGPDGLFYLLERRLVLPRFATRISRIRPPAWDQPETLVETAPGALDNHEGLHVDADAGRLVATTISDDNRFFLQRTEIAEFVLG